MQDYSGWNIPVRIFLYIFQCIHYFFKFQVLWHILNLKINITLIKMKSKSKIKAKKVAPKKKKGQKSKKR